MEAGVGLDRSVGSPLKGPNQPTLSLGLRPTSGWGVSAHMRWNPALDPKRTWQEYGHWGQSWWKETGLLRAQWVQLDWLPGTYQNRSFRGELGLSLGLGRMVHYVPATPPAPLTERAVMLRPSLTVSSQVARWTLRSSWGLEVSRPPAHFETLSLPPIQLHIGLSLQTRIPPPYKKP